MESTKVYACPFCGIAVPPPIPTHCTKCSNSFRDLSLEEYKEEQGLTEQLGSVVSGVRKQQEQIANRTNWWKEDDKVNTKKETNVAWDNEFATEYQRANNMTVEDSLKEIEEFNALVAMSEGEFDEAKWKDFIKRYKERTHKHKLNLPVEETFLQKLQENRNKEKDEKRKNGNSVNERANMFNSTPEVKSSQKDTLSMPPPKPKPKAQVPAKPKPQFTASKTGNGRKEMGKYLQKKDNQRKKLW